MKKSQIKAVREADKKISKILNDLEINVEGSIEYLDLTRKELNKKGERIRTKIVFFHTIKEVQ